MRSIIVAVVVLLWSSNDVRADILSACGGAGYTDPAELAVAAAVATLVATSDIPEQPRQELTARWDGLVDDNARVRRGALDFDDACASAKDRGDATRERIRQFEGRCGGAEPPDDCGAELQSVQAEYAEREAEYVAIQSQLAGWKMDTNLLAASLGGFVIAAERELATWFTGKKVYRMTAKSWIDRDQITEVSLRALKLRFEADEPPTSANSRGDYRLYQTFVVEVIFRQGAIKTAKFLKPSLQQDAGVTQVPVAPPEPMITPDGLEIQLVTVGFKGRIYVIDQKIAIAADRRSVTFRRKVEGHPSLWVLTLDKLGDTATWGLKLMSKKRLGSLGNLPTIWNSLELEVTAEGVRPSGDGSGFPSHRFWLGDDELDSRVQSDPSAYFHDD